MIITLGADIVERLRETFADDSAIELWQRYRAYESDRYEAADEIERLRDELLVTKSWLKRDNATLASCRAQKEKLNEEIERLRDHRPDATPSDAPSSP